jgi:hypothetical protein
VQRDGTLVLRWRGPVSRAEWGLDDFGDWPEVVRVTAAFAGRFTRVPACHHRRRAGPSARHQVRMTGPGEEMMTA